MRFAMKEKSNGCHQRMVPNNERDPSLQKIPDVELHNMLLQSLSNMQVKSKSNKYQT